MSRPLTFGPLEKEILEIVWKNNGGSCVRDIFCTLQNRRGIAYTTVMTVMNRLVDKGALHRQRDGKAHTYSALLLRQDVIQLTVRTFFQSLAEEGEVGIEALQNEFSKLTHKQQLEILKALAVGAKEQL